MNSSRIYWLSAAIGLFIAAVLAALVAVWTHHPEMAGTAIILAVTSFVCAWLVPYR